MAADNSLALFARCAPWDGYTFDPLPYIQAVNFMVPLGKEQALKAMQDYWQKAEARGDWLDDSTRLLLLGRLLFVPASAATKFPQARMGSPVIYSGLTEAKFPLFPLALLNDVPVLISPGYNLGGLPENPQNQFDFYKQQCDLRQNPLQPPANPLTLDNNLFSGSKPNKEARSVVRAQLLRLVRAVYPVPGEDEVGFYAKLSGDEVWQKHQEVYSALGAKWLGSKNNYEISAEDLV